MGLYFTMSAALHTFVIQQSHQCLSWFTAFDIFRKVKIVRASFEFFKFLFSPLNFMFTFGMSGFVAFPYLDKLSIPQREGRNMMVASLIFPLSHAGGFQTHPDFVLQCCTSFTWVSNTSFSGVWYLVFFFFLNSLKAASFLTVSFRVL